MAAVDVIEVCRCGLPLNSNRTCLHCDTADCPLCRSYNGENCQLAENLGRIA